MVKRPCRGCEIAWRHLNNADVISMTDTWEYPWYAAWDLAFHCIPPATVDPEFAKAQLLLLLREWYMHPNGQLPACEWAFGDVNPTLLYMPAARARSPVIRAAIVYPTLKRADRCSMAKRPARSGGRAEE